MTRVADANAPRTQPKGGITRFYVVVAASIFTSIAVIIIVIVSLYFSCAHSAFCFKPQSNIQHGNVTGSTPRMSTVTPSEVSSTFTTTRPMTPSEVSSTFTTTRPSAPLVDPAEKAQCWMKFQGVCVREDDTCPFFTTNFDITSCAKEHFCCIPDVRNFTDLPSRPFCGRAFAPPARLRIANGWKTVAWPWIVSIRKDSAHICGGTIISPTTIITAAHCFLNLTDLNAFSVVTGEFDITKDDPAEKTFAISNITSHDYDSVTAENDIALLTLNDTLVMDYHRQPACLPVPEDDFKAMADRSSDVDVCIVLGWGKGLGSDSNVMNELQMAALPLLNATDCKLMYDSMADYSQIVDPQQNMCTLLKLTDTCKGDSGGPLLCKRQDRMILAGIISWGPKLCADANQPAVYTKVTHFLPWVRSRVPDLPSNSFS